MSDSMRAFGKTLIFSVAAAASFGQTACKAARWRDQEKATETGQPSVPQLVGGADAIAGQAGPAFDVEEKSGKIKADLVLRLDHFPSKPQPGAANLPVCYPPFPNDFVVGEVMCSGQAGTTIPLIAANLRQECYTDPSSAKVTATAPLSMPGCARGAIMLLPFDPPLAVDAEAKDVATAP